MLEKPKLHKKRGFFIIGLISLLLIFIILIFIITKVFSLPLKNSELLKTQSLATKESFTRTVDFLTTKQGQIVTGTYLAKETNEKLIQETKSFEATSTQSAASTATQFVSQKTQDYLFEVENMYNLNTEKMPIFGPISSFISLENTEYVAGIYSDVNLKNFILEASIFPPYERNINGWDFGVFFRDKGTTDEFRLIITSGGFWTLENWENGQQTIINQGFTSALTLLTENPNFLILMVDNTIGHLIINNFYVASLDLSTRLDPGNISLMSGIYWENIIVGKNVTIEDFSIWSLPDN